MSPREPVIVGRFGAPYGIKGWLRVTSFTDPPENIERYQPWQVAWDGKWSELHPTGFKRLAKGVAVGVASVKDRDGASLYSGREIGVDASLLPEPDADELYWKDLIGLVAESPEGERLGSVTGLMPAGSHDVLVIESHEAGSPLLVPFHREYVPHVDPGAGRLIADVAQLRD